MGREQEEGVEVTAGGSTALSREQKEGVEVTAGGRREHSFRVGSRTE